MALLTRLLLLVCALVMPSLAQAQSDTLQVVVSCPEGANDPSHPNNPQARSCTRADLISNQCPCKVYWANRGGALTNVRFTIAGARLPDLPYYNAAITPDGNLGFTSGYGSLPSTFGVENQRGISPDGVTIIRGAIGSSGPNYQTINGYTFNQHVLLDAALGYSGTIVTRPSIAIGATGEFAFQIAPPYAYGPTPQIGTLTVTVTAAEPGLVTTPQVVTLETLPMTSGPESIPVSMSGLTSGPVKADGSLAVAERGPQTAVEHWINLPYDNGTAIVSDGNYDASNPSHHIIVDLTHLIADASITYATNPYSIHLDAQVSPDLAVPDSGLHANRVLRVVPDTNKLVMRTGYVSPWWLVALRYSAPLTASYAYLATAGRVIPNQRCSRSDQYPETRCAVGDFNFIAPPAFHQGWFYFAHMNSFQDGDWNLFAQGENGAIRGDRKVIADFRFDAAAVATLGDVTDLNLIYQVGGRYADGRDMRLDSVGFDEAGFNLTDTPHKIWVTNIAGDYGSDASLSERLLPAATDASWVLCAASDGGTAAFCDAASLAAANPRGLAYGMADVTHMRIEFPLIAQTQTLADNANKLRVWVKGTVLPVARASIDSSIPSASDATHASFGTKLDVSMNLGNAHIAGALTRTVEVDPRPRVYFTQFGVGFWDKQLQDSTFNTLPAPLNSAREVGCRIENRGEGNAYAPLVLEYTLPPGFDPAGDDATAPRLYQRDNLDAPDTTEVTWNPATRTYTLTMTAPSALLGLDSKRSTFYGYDLRISGTFVQGAPEYGKDTCRTVFTHDDTDGNIVARDFSTHIGFSQSNVYPSLRIEGDVNKSTVERHGVFTLATRLHNEVYDNVTGLALPSGATAGADEVAVFYRVNRDNDYPESVEHGGVAVAFESASSSEVGEVYVSVLEAPTRTSRTGLTSANGWTRCTTNPAPCDAAALAAIGIANPDIVRWVVFGYPRVEMTDTAPRSSRPGPGVPHDDVPWVGNVTVVDRDSDGVGDALPVVRAFLEVRSADTASPAAALDVDVAVDTGCDAALPNVGFGETEICDGYDNDCDGLFNEDLTRQVACAGLCPAVGSETCDVEGSWTNSTCQASVSCDDNNPCTSDSCDGDVCSNVGDVGAACDDGVNCTDGDACTASGACAGTAVVCTTSGTCEAARCDEASGLCVLSEATCSPLRFYGVVRTAGGLGSIRCEVVAGQPARCDMNGDELAVGPPMCGGGEGQ